MYVIANIKNISYLVKAGTILRSMVAEKGTTYTININAK